MQEDFCIGVLTCGYNEGYYRENTQCDDFSAATMRKEFVSCRACMKYKRDCRTPASYALERTE